MYKLKFTQKISFAAVFAAVCIIVKSLKFTALGVSVSFSYIPNFLSAIFLGPVYAMAVGFTGDILGTLLQGGTISPLILIGNTLMGGIMGMVFKYSYVKNLILKIIAGAFCVLVIVTYGINTLAMILPPLNIYSTYIMALSVRIPQGIVLAVNTLLVITLYFTLDKIYFKKYNM